MSDRIVSEKYIRLLLAAYAVHVHDCIRERRLPLTAEQWYELNKNKTPEQFAEEFFKNK